MRDIRQTDNKIVLNSLFVIQNFVHLLSPVLEREGANNMKEIETDKTVNPSSYLLDEDVSDYHHALDTAVYWLTAVWCLHNYNDG